MIQVKICGITNFEDARAAVEAGADLLGFIFYEPSPRYVTPETARDIIGQVREMRPGLARPLFVGVFVDAPLHTVAQTLQACRLDAVQLHGDEPPEFVAHFQGRAYKALRPQSMAEAESLIQTYLPIPRRSASGTTVSRSRAAPLRGQRSPNLPFFLLDAYHPGLYGGTGRVTDWTMAAAIARRHPIMLAGSLTPANVAAAIRAVRPWGVDVSSGVEARKGKKDHAKVRAFVQAVRQTEGKEIGD